MTGAVELLEKLLALDPMKRMSAHDALFEVPSHILMSQTTPCLYVVAFLSLLIL